MFMLRTLQWALPTPAWGWAAPGLPRVFPVLLPAPGALLVLVPPVILSGAVSPAVPT